MHSSGGEKVLFSFDDRRRGDGVMGAPQENVPSSSFASEGIDSVDRDLIDRADLGGLFATE